MHRRKTSKETVEQENLVVSSDSANSTSSSQKVDKPASISFPTGNGNEGNEVANGLPELQLQGSPLKSRMNTDDAGIQHRQPPASAGPYRTGFGSLAPPPPNANGHGYPYSASPLRKSFTHGHGRTLSSSGANFASPMLSPLPSSQSQSRSHHRHSAHFPSHSVSLAAPPSPGPNMNFKFNGSPPEGVGGSAQLPSTPQTPPLPPPPGTPRRHHHQRIHSRNLSVFFPRPGSLSTSSIAEDSDVVQEATVTLNEDSPQFKSVRLQNPPGPRRLGEGFTFGGKPERTPSTSSSDGGGSTTSAATSSTPSKPKRRGHHHKHSLSHNFFSFLEPGAVLRPSTSPEQQVWSPASPRLTPGTATSSTFAQAQSESGTAVGLTSPNPDPLALTHSRRALLRDTLIVSAVQFVLGASLWVSGQQNGSLACTGLGYWVVFDAFGVALRHALPVYLSGEGMASRTRRPYGNGRVETLFLFAQTIYLIFSSVYVSKEAVEHLLLAAGDGHHHHHHPRDEDMDSEGMHLPTFLILTTIVSLLSTCLFYDNHRRLITTSGHKLPSFLRIFSRSRNYGYCSSFNSATPAAIVLANPFTVAPLLFSVALLGGMMILPAPQHESYDLLLALFEAVLTFKIAYPAVEVQGTVLLQTAPPRGLPGGRMEAFLRVMREIERHPLVLHLPAPHIWQLTPSTTSLPPPSYTSISYFSSKPKFSDINDNTPLDALVVTLELHVRRDTDDGEVLALTRWAHEKCRLALGLGLSGSGSGFASHLNGHGNGSAFLGEEKEKEREREREEDGAEITIGIVKG